MFNDIPRGLSLAVGTIPVAAAGLAPTRRGRLGSAFLGVFVAVPILLGSTLAGVPWLAVRTLFLLAVAAVALAHRTGRLGQIVLSLGLPMVGIGFSYDDIATGAALALIMVAGSLYAAVVSLLWPEFSAPAAAPTSPPSPSFDYGVRLGLAGATAATIGFALDL